MSSCFMLLSSIFDSCLNKLVLVTSKYHTNSESLENHCTPKWQVTQNVSETHPIMPENVVLTFDSLSPVKWPKICCCKQGVLVLIRSHGVSHKSASSLSLEVENNFSEAVILTIMIGAINIYEKL